MSTEFACNCCYHTEDLDEINRVRRESAERLYTATGKRVLAAEVTTGDRVECLVCRGTMAATGQHARVAGNAHREQMSREREKFIRAIRRDPLLRDVDVDRLWEIVMQILGRTAWQTEQVPYGRRP